jgi:hypothetical protein
MRSLSRFVFGALVLFASLFSRATELGIDSTRFTIDGKPTFLLGMSYYAGTAAPDDFVRKDLDDMQRDGFNWIRVWATWTPFGADVSAVYTNGAPREPYLTRLEKLIKECDRRGMIVDVTLARENRTNGIPRIAHLEDHARAVRTLVEQLRPYRNWYLDLGNERNISDSRFVPFEDLHSLREVARELDPKRLVTASHSSEDKDFAEQFGRYLLEAKVDFLTPHRPRSKASPSQTAIATKLYLQHMKTHDAGAPILYQEPFRRGYTNGWEPTAEDFLTDLRGAIEGGAAGWCFHNGPQLGTPQGQPRRSFDMHEKRLYDQLDPVELEVAKKAHLELKQNKDVK